MCSRSICKTWREAGLFGPAGVRELQWWFRTKDVYATRETCLSFEKSSEAPAKARRHDGGPGPHGAFGAAGAREPRGILGGGSELSSTPPPPPSTHLTML